MSVSKQTRRSGIELLRIYAIMSVIILHYFNGGIGGGTNYVRGTVSNFTARLFLSLAFCAVDLFVMISGYFLGASSKRSFSKIVFLLLEASIMRVALYIINAVIDSEPITAAGIFRTALSYGYFIVFYSVIYLISPLINAGFDRLDEKNSKKAISILFVLFAIIPAVAAVLSSYNVLGSNWTDISTITKEGSFEGFSVVNFFLCYTIGAYIRRWHNDEKKRVKVLALLFLNTAALLVWGYIDRESAYTYDNPLVILEAAFLLLFFKDLKFKNKVVNELASSGFTCYLIHVFFFRYIAIEKYASKSWYVLIVHVIICTVGIYLVCYAIHKVYGLCTGWLVKLLSPSIDKINLTIRTKNDGQIEKQG